MKDMRTLLTTLVGILFLLAQAQAQQTTAIEKFYQKYESNEAFTVVYISQHMFSLFADLEVEDKEDQMVLEVLQDLQGLHILVTEENPERYYQEAIKLVKDPAYEVLMKLREEETRLQFFVKKNGKTIDELLLLVQEDDDEFVLISITGVIDLKKIAALAGAMEIEGLEHLKHVKTESTER